MKAFIAELDSKPNLLEEFDNDIWSYLIEKAIVNQDGSITFIFNNGKEIKLQPAQFLENSKSLQ